MGKAGLAAMGTTFSLFPPSGLGFLSQEFVLTTKDQEHMWVGWPGVVTTAQ